MGPHEKIIKKKTVRVRRKIGGQNMHVNGSGGMSTHNFSTMDRGAAVVVLGQRAEE